MKTMFYMMDSIDHLINPEFYDKAKACDFSVVTSMAMKEALENNGAKHVYHILQGVDPKQFHPVEGVEKKYDVIFIGQRTSKRDVIIGSLLDAGITVACYGPGWADNAYGEDFNNACAGGKILLAINNTDSDQDSFSDRILRYMATGGCVVTEYSKGLESYFKNDSELCWPEAGEMIDLIKYLLKNPEAMKRIAEAGHQRVLKDYTWDKVAEKIMNIIKEVKPYG